MGVLLACLASAFFLALDVLRKVLGARLSAVDIVIGINVGAATVFAVVMTLSGIGAWDSTFLLLAAIESVTFTVASLLYVRAVTVSPLSLTIPYLAFTPVVSAVVAVVVLGEMPGLTGCLGILLVVSGAALLHLDEGTSFTSLLRAPFNEPGSWMMLLVALIWGTTTSIDKVAIEHGSEALLAFPLTAGSSIILLVVRQLRSPPRFSVSKRTGRKTLGLLGIAALVGAAAVLCQFFAYREMFVAYVETIKRAGGLGALVIGVFLFNEGGFANRFPVAVLMVIGIMLILLG